VSINETGQRVCRELNINPDDLLDKSLETVEKQLAETESYRSQKNPTT
jgi:hypothetical protein